jgi:hypothetical protein
MKLLIMQFSPVSYYFALFMYTYIHTHIQMRYMPYFCVVFRYPYLLTDRITSVLGLPIQRAWVLNVALPRPVIYLLHDVVFLPSCRLPHIFALVKETD